MKKEFNFNGELPYIQKITHKHYSEYYTDELKELTYNFYRRDFEIFNYSKEL